MMYLFQVLNNFWIFAAVISKPGPVVLPPVTPFWEDKRLLNSNWRNCSYCKETKRQSLAFYCGSKMLVLQRGVENTKLQK